jgi:hypothetical protein
MMRILAALSQNPTVITAVNDALEIEEKSFNCETLSIYDIADFVTKKSREEIEGFKELEIDVLNNVILLLLRLILKQRINMEL